MKRKSFTLSTILTFWALVLTLLSAVAPAADYVTYLHADVQGSPLLATDEQGQVVWQEEYEPWGARQVKDTASASISRGSAIWYTGKEEEASLGMYYYGARWYGPYIGQFCAIDPVDFKIENPRSFNRYTYANNSPLMYIDPDGKWAVSISAFAGIGGGLVFGVDSKSDQSFVSIRMGVGAGGGVNFNPTAGRPGGSELGLKKGLGGIAAGLYGDAGVGIGPIGTGIEANLGAQSNGYSGFDPYATFGLSGLSIGGERSGVNASVSGGAEFTFFGE